MGKKIVIKGGNFYTNAIEHENQVTKRYLYGITDEQFSKSNGEWTSNAFGFGIKDQSAIQGKTIHGIRLVVSTPGSLTLYKASSPSVNYDNALTEVASISTNKIGLQDIDFSQPITLASNEYIILGSFYRGQKTLLGKTVNSKGETVPIRQGFYYLVGHTEVTDNETTKGFNVDFYQYVTDDEESNETNQ